jgi:predicted transcriptional regulator
MRKEDLIILIDKNFTTKQISKELQISQTTVRYWLKKFDLKTNHKSIKDPEFHKTSGFSNDSKNSGGFSNLVNQECIHCKKTINDKLSIFLNHVRWCEANLSNSRKRKIDVICQCGNNFESSSYRTAKFCSKSCASKFSISKEKRKTILNKLKAWYEKNPDEHPWKKSKKFISIPCENFKLFLIDQGFCFVEEFKPIKNRRFSLDIAFPDAMIAIEINGNQHYDKNKNLKQYYQDRHDLIESQGWKIIELHFKDSFSSKKRQEIIKLLKEFKN